MKTKTAEQNHTPTPWKQGDNHRIESATPGGGCSVVVTEHSIGDYRDRAFIVRAVNSHAALVQALEYAADFIKLARNHFPKSIQHRDKFQLENTCAVIGKAIAEAKEAA